MPKLVWCGNQPWDKAFPEAPIPAEKYAIKLPGSVFIRSIPYGAIPALCCLLIIFLKKRVLGWPNPSPVYVPIGVLLGLLLLPVHEMLHACCFQRGQTVYIGISLEKFAAFAVCHEPISRKRYIVMSLAPVLLGLLPALLFLLFSQTSVSSALLIPVMVMGFLSPMPDYRDVYQVLRQTPSQAMIQSQNSGLFWYIQTRSC